MPNGIFQRKNVEKEICCAVTSIIKIERIVV
jgi:hypothetical protein